MQAHATQPAAPTLMELAAQGMARDAQSALDGMIDQARHVVMHATDMADMARGMAALNLSEDAFARQMAQGMMVANLLGEFEVYEEMAANG